MPVRRLKVLLIAYACRPGESSEREVGWKWARIIQGRHDVTVLTRATHRPQIEAWCAANSSAGPMPEFFYYDLPAWVKRLKRGYLGLYAYYALWSFFAILAARRQHRQSPFDLTHFLTFGTLLWPQFAYLMPTRYVLGPVGGGEHIPLMMWRAFPFATGLKIVLRGVVQRALYLSPGFWLNILRADRILTRTAETRALLPRFARAKSELFLETAMPDWMGDQQPPERSDEGFTIVTVGRLIYSKVNRLGFEALAEFKAAYGRPFRYVVVGDGPERAALEQTCAALGLDEVTFLGKLPGPEVLLQLEGADVYFSTTAKEGGTWAFFEAIASRLPIICLKVNGPDMIVGDGCGIKVPTTGYDAAKEDLAQGLLMLAEDSGLREDYAEKALDHVDRLYTWERVEARIDTIYAEVTGEGVGTPG